MKNTLKLTDLFEVLAGNRAILTAALLCMITLPGRAGDPVWLEQLRSPDRDIRRKAIDKIQTLGDPRIPEACLPLLADEGRSIRRQAARAIGSRFDQIPKGRIDIYLEALKKCAADGPEDVALMADRATGLLTQDYSSAAFSKSPDGKWALYERRRLPVIANVARQVHMLLSPEVPTDVYSRDETFVQWGNIETSVPFKQSGLLKLMVTNEPVSDLFAPMWQPEGLAVAFSPIIQASFFRPVCIWRARDGEMRVWTVKSFAPLLRGRFPHWGTTMDFVKWDGARAVIRIYDCDDAGGGPYDPEGVRVLVDIRTWKTAIVP